MTALHGGEHSEKVGRNRQRIDDLCETQELLVMRLQSFLSGRRRAPGVYGSNWKEPKKKTSRLPNSSVNVRIAVTAILIHE